VVKAESGGVGEGQGRGGQDRGAVSNESPSEQAKPLWA